MAVPPRFLKSFLPELNDARKQADAVSDADGWPALRRLWLDFFMGKLGAMRGPELRTYLSSIAPWQVYGEWTVFKTIDEPSIAFTAQAAPNGDLTLICLGICYRYPGGASLDWWIKVILPRLQSIQ